jgi:hypothetical protein
MPRPRNERLSLEEKLAELPAQIAAYQQDLAPIIDQATELPRSR